MNAGDWIILIPLILFVVVAGLIGLLSWLSKEKKPKTPQKFNVGKCTLTMIFKDGREWKKEVIGEKKWRDYGDFSEPYVERSTKRAREMVKSFGQWIPVDSQQSSESGEFVHASEVKVFISEIQDHWVER